MKKRIGVLLGLGIPLVGFAAIGYANRKADFLSWLSPAVNMISLSTSILFIALIIISFLFKKRLSVAVDKFSAYLRRRNLLSTLVTGCFTSTILAFISLWLDIIFETAALLLFPFILLSYLILLSSRLRKKWLLNKKALWLQTILFLSIIFSVIVFILGVGFHIISIPEPFDARDSRLLFSRILYYPYDAIYQMFQVVIFYGLDVIISLFFVSCGNLLRIFRDKFSQKQESYSE